MSAIRGIFWDVGGVLLSNAWDHEERKLAIDRFHLENDEFEKLHKESVPAFEEGRISLDEYLQRTVFVRQRPFPPQDFTGYMFALSKPKADVLEIARRLRGKYLMGTINNESRELNRYRIETFGLTQIFDVFVSSCFVGLRKPDPRIYRLALDLTQQKADECCFIDDRPVNIQAAAGLGFRTILLTSAKQLKRELGEAGISVQHFPL